MTLHEPALSRAQARRVFLRNQLLLDPAPSPVDVVETLVAIQTQYAASLPLALAARLESYPSGWHEAAISRGDLVKSWTLRHTVHTHSRQGHALLLAALGASWRERFLKWNEIVMGHGADALPAVEAKILAALEDGPLTRTELHARVEELATLRWAGWGQDVKGLAFLGLVAFANNDGVTRFKSHWTPDLGLSADHAQEIIARRYFSAYGPATVQDFAVWSSLSVASARRAVDRIAEELTQVAVEGLAGRRYAINPREPLEPTGVRLLPKFDAIALAHRDKGLFFGIGIKSRVFRPAGQIEATVIAGDEVVGTWRLKRRAAGGDVVVEPFVKLTKGLLRGVEAEAQRVGEALGLKKVDVRVMAS